MDLRLQSLSNLLRQAVVAGCSAMDAYLPLLLRTYLPTVIRVRGRDFVPTDRDTRDFFKDFRLDLASTVRLVNEPQPEEFLGTQLLEYVRAKTFGNRQGLHIVGALLGLDEPWDLIARRLGQNKGDLQTRLEAIVKRRNDIVHRADRSSRDPDADPQEIHLSWTTMHVDTIRGVVLTLDELVEQRMREYEAVAATMPQPELLAPVASGGEG